MGTESESGDRWVTLILNLTQAYRLQNRLSYPVLVDAINNYLHGTAFDLSWIEKIYEKEWEQVTP